MNFPIRTEKLSKRFRGVTALDELDLEVPESGMYALIGSNGAGKSTAIRILMNLLRPSAGRGEVLGVESTKLSPNQLASIGYLSENLDPPGWMKVGYFLSYYKEFYPTWDDALAAELISDYRLPLDRPLKHLSRGMLVKALLVSSLAYRPKLLILDEPFSGLDPLVRDELIEGVLSSADGTTVLISSHDLNEVESFVTHIGYLDDGRLRFSEEMASLTARFREIEIVGGAGVALPDRWPSSWKGVQRSGNLVRCVDTQFEDSSTIEQLRGLLPEQAQVFVKPMPLRAIFVALARASRAEAPRTI